MKKRIGIRIISFCTATVFATSGYAVKTRRELYHMRLEAENNYSQSLSRLGTGINNISVLLEKARYIMTAKQLSHTATELLTEAEASKAALSALPLNGELAVLNRFFSQVGNYAVSVSGTLGEAEHPNDEYDANITALRNTAVRISEAVAEASMLYGDPSKWAKEVVKRLEDEALPDSVGTLLDELEDSLTDYPTLVYDGPYSDHITEKEPLMIKNAPEIAENEAIEKAALAAGCASDKLKFDEAVNGKIPTYRFSGEGVTVTVSKSGGYTVYMRKSRAVAEGILEYRQALEKAKRYLESMGMCGFTETYYFTDEGVCVVNFAYLDGKTVCYTDLVKVGVAMDNGEIMLYEASGYLTNHTERAYETPAVSASEAAQLVSDKLKIRSTALALIPTESAGEVRCYEFVCEAADGGEILVYINAVTMEEEKLLILLRSDGGVLTK